MSQVTSETADQTTTPAEPQDDQIPDQIVIKRNCTEENPDGNSWLFKTAKLKKKNASDPDRYALVPERPLKEGDYTFEGFISFLGTEVAAETAYQRARGISAALTESATNKDKTFSLKQFIQYVQEWSARGESYKILNAERDELMQQVIKLSMDTRMVPVDKQAKLQDLGTRLQKVMETLEWKKSQGKDENEAEPEVEQNSDGANAQQAAK